MLECVLANLRGVGWRRAGVRCRRSGPRTEQCTQLLEAQATWRQPSLGVEGALGERALETRGQQVDLGPNLLELDVCGIEGCSRLMDELVLRKQLSLALELLELDVRTLPWR